MGVAFSAWTLAPEVTAAYVAAGASALLGLVAIFISLRGLGIQKESARAATLSAEAAQRANWLTEQRMLREAAEPSGRLVAPEDQRAATPSVTWSLDRKSKNTFVLRNVGGDVATGVSIPNESAAAISRNLPESATLRPGESAEFLMIPAMGHPVPNEIRVVSQGYADGQIVPVPN